MENRLTSYRAGHGPLPATHSAWPLHGAGLSNLGCDRAMTVGPRPEPGPDQILVRNDAAGLCFSDVKVIQMGAGHPRLTGRDLAVNPLVPGHEASVTVVAVGAGLADRYRVGQRFAVQPDIWFGGRSLPYGYALDGAFQQYGLIGREILAGDAGSYLVPIPDGMSYAAAALTEPWACVEASYRATYRTTLKAEGRAWFIGVPAADTVIAWMRSGATRHRARSSSRACRPTWLERFAGYVMPAESSLTSRRLRRGVGIGPEFR